MRENEWRRADGEPFFRSARLDCALARLSGVWRREVGAFRLLAIPYRQGDRFPLEELFCFADVREEWVLYCFSATGKILFPQNFKIGLPKRENV